VSTTSKPEQQFDAIAEAIARVEDPTIRAATAQDIFGRAGTQLLPLFDQGVEGMRKLSDQAHELGRIYDEEAAAKAARLVDAQTSLKTAFQGLAVSLAENIVPALSKLVEGISSIVGKFNQWTQEHPGLASAISKVAIGVGALLTALGPLVVMIPRIITGVKGLAVALKFLTGPMGLVAAGATAIAIALLKQKAAQEAATKAAKQAAEAEDDLFRRIKAATDAAGMSDLAFLKLTEKYHHNAAAMAMAIKRGKEGEELQKALIEVSKKHYDTKREETGAVEELSIAFDQKLLPAMTAVAEKQESWIEFLRDQGLQTISQKQERANELYTIIDNLNAAYERGEISTATWAEAVKTATKEIEALTSAEYVEVGASRDLSTAIQQVSATMDSAVFSYEEVKEAGAVAAKETVDSWSTVSTTIQTQWTDIFKGMLTGTTSWSDGLGSIWSNIKGQFSSFTSLLSGDWKENFLKKGILGVKDFVSTLLQDFGSLGKNLGSIFGGIGKSISGIFKGLGGIGKSISSVIGGIGKIAQGFSPGGMIAGAIGGLVGGLFGKKGLGRTSGENIRKTAEFTQSLRDIVQKDIRDNQLNWIIGRQDVANSALTGILPNKFDAVNKRLDQVKGYTSKTAKACEAMVKALKKVTSAARGAVVQDTRLVMVHGTLATPEIISPTSAIQAAVKQAISTGPPIEGDRGSMVESLKKVASTVASAAAKGLTGKAAKAYEAMLKDLKKATATAQKTIVKGIEQHVVAKDDTSKAKAYEAMVRDMQKAAAIKTAAAKEAKRPVVVNDNRTVEVRGTMITDRDYVRQRLLPEILAALDANSGHMRRKLKEYIGIA